MAERLFRFVQADLPLTRHPPEGQWSLRLQPDGAVLHLISLQAVQASTSPRRKSRRWKRSRRAAPRNQPIVPALRATVIDPQDFDAVERARKWLRELDAQQEAEAAFAALNKLLYAHRIAAADPHAHGVSPADAIALRAGFGTGEQVAAGSWQTARELYPPAHDLPSSGAQTRTPRRSGIIAAHREERFVAMLAARERPLICEELALRARLDLDGGKPALAAIELKDAIAAALAELPRDGGAGLDARLTELETLTLESEEQLEHALSRLEAALRAWIAAKDQQGASIAAKDHKLGP